MVDTQNFRMIDVGPKRETLRSASARGCIRIGELAFAALISKSNPKGDVLAMAEVAAIMAAKKTPEVLPLCHPLNLTSVRVSFELNDPEIQVTAVVSAVGRTGVEMEALSAVNGALLCIYDMSKVIDPVMSISNVQLLEKTGGKKRRWVNPEIEPRPAENKSTQLLTFGVITSSDRAFSGSYQDQSGPVLSRLLEEGGDRVLGVKLVPDSKESITEAIQEWISQDVDVVCITGGTGLGPRDVTPEVIETLSDRLIPGIGELIRQQSALFVTESWLSRSVCGLIGSTLVIGLPGRPTAIREIMPVLRPLLPHAVAMARGSFH